ncbi:MAG: alpha-amylase [Fibrobacterota bacterium]|nr:alpha-amylase [Fibrobacterota bacterium]QQS05819.1 MAG: alpha-amylase [Fibrobacterota bacterium]
MKDVILHAFNWKFKDIGDMAQRIADAGYGAVLFPPPLYSDENGPEWWQRYQPKDYRIVRSHLGRKADVQRAIDELAKWGVRSYVDVVFNHMANEWREDRWNFPGKAELERYKKERAEFEKDKLFGNLDEGFFNEHDFHPPGDISNWSDKAQLVDLALSGLPDLVLSIAVVKDQVDCLDALVKMGFSGFRVDALKHLPVAHINTVFRSGAMQGKYLFGETLTFDRSQNDLFLWPVLAQTGMPCYDFPLQQTMLKAFTPSGSLRDLINPAAYGNALPWDKSVTFTVTHDVPNNDGFRGMLLDPHDEYLANAYILGRDGGVPLMYSDNGESARQYPSDKGRWEGLWCRYDVTQMINFHNHVQGEPLWLLWESDGLLVFARGDRGIVAINKTGEWAHPDIWTWGLRWGNWRCQLHQHQMNLWGDRFNFAVPPRQAQMWLWEG